MVSKLNVKNQGKALRGVFGESVIQHIESSDEPVAMDALINTCWNLQLPWAENHIRRVGMTKLLGDILKRGQKAKRIRSIPGQGWMAEPKTSDEDKALQQNKKLRSVRTTAMNTSQDVEDHDTRDLIRDKYRPWLALAEQQ